MLPSLAKQLPAMVIGLQTHLSTIEQMAFSQGTMVRLLAACAMGAVVGLERESRHKASGLRTNMLICMGASLFTLLSISIAGTEGTSRTQIASNIVQGIGFLGAGMILHSRNRVTGLTSAATVWVVAAIGMACGAGQYLGAAIATAIVYVALRFVGMMESRSDWKRFPMLYEVRGHDEESMFTDIFAVLDQEHLRFNMIERDKLGSVERVTFSINASRERHQGLLAKLVACDAADHVVAYHDEEEE